MESKSAPEKRLTILEKYAAKGWLNHGDNTYSSRDRLESGNRFYADFYKSGLVSIRAKGLAAVRVDGGNDKEDPVQVLIARDRFFNALRCLSREYVYPVTHICLYNSRLRIPTRDMAIYKHEVEVAKEKLCRGLDELTVHYQGRYWTGKPKMQSMHQGNIWEGFVDYCKERGL